CRAAWNALPVELFGDQPRKDAAMIEAVSSGAFSLLARSKKGDGDAAVMQVTALARSVPSEAVRRWIEQCQTALRRSSDTSGSDASLTSDLRHRGSPKLKTILIVDSDEGVRKALGDVLQRDFRILGATSAEHALQMAMRDEVDLMLVDVRLPGIGGRELLERMK